MFEFSMIPTINKPTRVTSYTATAIDSIVTNSIFDNAIIKTGVFDHFPIIFTIQLKTTPSPKNHVDQFRYKLDFNEKSLNPFKQILFETTWDSLKNIAAQMSCIMSFCVTHYYIYLTYHLQVEYFQTA